jgi:hypothetical protein
VSGVDSAFSAPAVAAAVTERAVARLLRGSTWQAIVREIAWHAVAEAHGDPEQAVSIMPVADEVLSELVDGIECRADSAAVRAWQDHLEWRPHDLEGAELVATIAASEEAERLVVAAYAEARRRTEEAARTRRQAASARAPRRRRFLRRERRRRNAPPPPSPIDLGDLGEPREQYGWPRRDAA